MTKHLGESDFLVVMVNTININNHKALYSFIKNISNTAKYTNLLLLLKCDNLDDEKLCSIVKNKFLFFQRSNINCSMSVKIDYGMKRFQVYNFISNYLMRIKHSSKCVLKSIKCTSKIMQEIKESESSFLEQIETIILET